MISNPHPLAPCLHFLRPFFNKHLVVAQSADIVWLGMIPFQQCSARLRNQYTVAVGVIELFQHLFGGINGIIQIIGIHIAYINMDLPF